MEILNSWKFCIIIYLIFSVIFNQCYKASTKTMKKDGAMTVLIELIASFFCLFMIPLFKTKFPSDFKVYIFMLIAIIFYTINNRLSTTSRSGLEASTYSVIKQLSTVFMIIAGLLFFKESFILNKFIGAFLIVFSNVLVFYRKSIFKINKYILFGILANISLTVALLIDVNYSNEFNLSFYVLLTLLIPSILIFLVEKILIRDIFNEFNQSNKLIVILTSISWAVMMIFKLKAYQLGDVIIIAPLCSLTVILNIIFGYLIFKEKSNLLKKVIAGILIIIGVILIKL